MRIALALLAFLALLLALPAPVRADPLAPTQGEDLFKWGEYDSLIRVLEPVTRHPSVGRTRADTLARAKSFLFLGVAFYATGKRERADEAFMRAVELDAKVRLDRFYVTEEIANHFQAIALDAFHSRVSGPPERTAVAASPARPAQPQPQKPTGGGLRPAAGRKWIWLGLGATTALAAGGGYYLLTRHEGDSEKTTVVSLTE